MVLFSNTLELIFKSRRWHCCKVNISFGNGSISIVTLKLSRAISVSHIGDPNEVFSKFINARLSVLCPKTYRIVANNSVLLILGNAYFLVKNAVTTALSALNQLIDKI